MNDNRNKRAPRPEDIYAGEALRRLRMLSNMPQAKLARALGLTFQQIQKYERGTNRMAVSTVCRLCVALDVSPLSFFEDKLYADILPDLGWAMDMTPEEARLLHLFRGVPDPMARRAVLSFVSAVAGRVGAI